MLEIGKLGYQPLLRLVGNDRSFIDDTAGKRRKIVLGCGCSQRLHSVGGIARRERPRRLRGVARRKSHRKEEHPKDQLPFPKSTVGAVSAPSLAWNGVIGLAP